MKEKSYDKIRNNKIPDRIRFARWFFYEEAAEREEGTNIQKEGSNTMERRIAYSPAKFEDWAQENWEDKCCDGGWIS